MKIAKGEIGYLNYKRKKSIISSIIGILFILIIFFIGLYIYETRLNIFTFISVLLCLPVAKILVGMIIIIKYKSYDISKAKKLINEFSAIGIKFDFVFTTEKSFYEINIVAFIENKLYCLSTDNHTDKNSALNYIRKMLNDNNLNQYDVKLYDNEKRFIDIIEGANNIALVDGFDKYDKANEELLGVLYSMSL